MTAPLREVYANDAQDILDGGIDDSQTTLTLTDASEFPATGNFRIVCQNEYMLCTGRSGDTLTVVRGIEGSAAAAHGDGITVAQILTVDGFERHIIDNVPLFGQFPVLNKLVAANGSTLLTSADFSWVNQETATVSDSGGTVCLRAPPTGGNDIRALVVSAPSPTWTLIVAIQAFTVRDDGGSANPIMGLVLRESSSGKLISFGFNVSSTVSMRFGLDYWTDANTYGGSTPWKVSNPITSNFAWLKITDNNTNLVFSISPDGIEWVQVASLSRTAHMSGGPNQIGIMVNNSANASAYDALLRLIHWHTE